MPEIENPTGPTPPDTNPVDLPDIPDKGSQPFSTEPAETPQEQKPSETSSEASNTAPK
jgi:hypothetical protein